MRTFVLCTLTMTLLVPSTVRAGQGGADRRSAVRAEAMARAAALRSASVELRHAARALHNGLAAQAVQARLAAAGATIDGAALSAAAMRMHAVAPALEAARAAFAPFSAFDHGSSAFQRALDGLTQEPRPAAAPQDPADSLWRNARERLNRGDYRDAARLFRRIRTEARFERSTYRPESYYWEAFALSRLDGRDNLRQAREILRRMHEVYPRQAGSGDAAALATTIDGRLARLGDNRAAAEIAERAAAAASVATASSAAATASQSAQCPQDDENDVRVVALNALLQMDAASALPILKEVLARRDACSAQLRRRAIFMISQKNSPESEQILLQAVRNDPDPEVREQAVFWLSQVDSESAVDALDQILRTSTDADLQEKAVFALSQHHSARAAEILRDYATRADVPEEIRAKAIFWIGQRSGPENAAFLKSVYPRLQDEELKQRVLQAMAQRSDTASANWLMDVALNQSESVEVRKQALFWAGQTRHVSLDRLLQLYDRVSDPEMKEQLIFVYSQRGDEQAVTKLMDIARNEQDAELRKKAIFWLSQSKDPRVAKFLLEIISR